ncbi:CopY/TcrY family copper transport repressor [Streptococcus uberis]
MMEMTSSELEVMRVIWTAEEVKSSDIIEILQQKWSWSPSTIKTLLGRLVDKNLVTIRREGRAYVYQSLVNQKDYHLKMLESNLNQICQRQHQSLLRELIKKLPMTDVDSDAWQALLLEKKKETVAAIPCNCIPGQCQCMKGGHSNV